ncbi:MAG: tetratricopeptide repeat protein, partial [Methylophilus sp.]
MKLAPNFAQAIFNLACVLKDMGLYAQAEKQFKQGIKFDTSHAVMYFHLAEVISQQQRLKEALPFYKKSIELNPQDTESMLKLGVGYLTCNRIDDAIATLTAILQVDADNASAHNALGLAYQVHKQDEMAEQHFMQAIAIRADYVAPYKNLGLLYKDMGRGVQAEACYRKALDLEPPSAETINNLAVLNINQGRYAEAETLCRQALEVNPQYGDSWNNLGLVLQARMYHLDAEAAFEQALKYQPNDVITLMNYGVTLNSLGKLTQAETCLKKAIKLDPNNAGCYVNLSNTYLDQSNIEAAINNSKKALALEPTHLLAHDNLLFAMEYSSLYSASTRLEAAHDYGRVVTAQAQAYQTWHVAAQTKRLRVGIVSGDLRQHPVAYFLKNAIKGLDYSQIDLFAYTPDGRTDATTLELKPYFSGWKSLAGLKDADAAAVIHQDGIHILLDLSGHSAGNRLPMFAWKPAPVQASWLGYWATTGVPAIDYVLADEIGVPTENRAQFTESVKYLAQTRMCFTPPETSLAVATLPALANGYITFASFQNMAKVSDEVIALWVTVMQAVPDSRLRWQSKTFIDAKVIQATQARFAKFGLDSKRLSFHGKVSREEYLAAHAEVDLILDSFPFTGGTTTCEALWMGVPTLTLAGNTMIARQGASLLSAAGLSDWIVGNREDFIQQASLICADLNALANLRSKLRAKVQSSALFDSALFGKNLNNVLWEIWQEKLPQLLESHRLVAEAENDTTDKQHIQNSIDAQHTTIQLVSATRMSEQVFWEKSALGLSLKRHMQQNSNLKASIAYENTRGLSTIFNQSIANADKDTTLVFIHDDVWIDETNFADAVLAGLQQFDVIGVAGNKRRIPQQPAWAFVDVNFTWDNKENLSGSVAHGAHAYGEVSNYGPVPAACELMDGVFLAAKKSTLLSKQVQFDEQFDFHFYDLDFCRSARNANLTLGTWPIKLTHQSGGAFGSAQWQAKYQLYLKKWENMDTTLPTTDDFSDAINEVFQQAEQHQQAGEIEQAVALYMEILQVQPQHAEANHNLGF